jgi:ABC-type uncharacterized transport system permease subunit
LALLFGLVGLDQNGIALTKRMISLTASSFIVDPFVIAVTACLFYLGALLLQWFRMTRGKTISSQYLQGLFFIAIILHGYLLYKWIDIGIGQNLSRYNLFSLVAWLIALLVALTAWKKPIDNLTLLICPLAILSIGLVLYFPAQLIIDTQSNPFALWHILLSTIVISVLIIAALQALILAIQERQLRSHPSGVVRFLPALQTMEALLFQLIITGFVLLTVLIITSAVLFYPLDTAMLRQKMFVSLCAWMIFLILLWGRFQAGWRGRTAVQWTLFGVFILVIIYFGIDIQKLF